MSECTFIIVFDVFTHAYDIINTFFNLQAYLEHWVFIIAYSSYSTLLVFMDAPNSLLQTNYLQNIITMLF